MDLSAECVVDEVSRALGIGAEFRPYALCASGRLPVVRIGRWRAALYRRKRWRAWGAGGARRSKVTAAMRRRDPRRGRVDFAAVRAAALMRVPELPGTLAAGRRAVRARVHGAQSAPRRPPARQHAGQRRHRPVGRLRGRGRARRRPDRPGGVPHRLQSGRGGAPSGRGARAALMDTAEVFTPLPAAGGITRSDAEPRAPAGAASRRYPTTASSADRDTATSASQRRSGHTATRLAPCSGHVCRFRGADGRRRYGRARCGRCIGRLRWRWASWPAPRPLYGLDRIVVHPNAPSS